MSDRNRAIDALIAEHAFGKEGCMCSLHEGKPDYTRFQHGGLPYYSTDPSASKQLRDRMREKGWLFIVMANIDDFAASAFQPSESIDVAAGETPEIRHKVEETAVALVALSALGIEAPK